MRRSLFNDTVVRSLPIEKKKKKVTNHIRKTKDLKPHHASKGANCHG
jgi:hypothetical protein